MNICYCGHKKEIHKSVTRSKVCMRNYCECLDFKEATCAPFVKMKHITLRLTSISSEPVYYRDAGAWAVNFKVVGDRLVADVPDKNSLLHHAHGLELVPCTVEEYKEDNGRYSKF